MGDGERASAKESCDLMESIRLVQDAKVHGSGIKVDFAVVLVLFGVESH